MFVSTQITEASLDIDFDVIITELCGAANIVQRLARCYRRREHDTEGPNVHIYNTGNDMDTVYDKTIFELTANYFRRNNNKLFTEEAKMELIKEVYSSEALKDSEFFSRFRKELNRLRNIPFDLYSKKDAKKFFRDIAESITAIPVSVYNKNIDKIEAAIEKLSSKNFKDRLQGQQIIDKYTISINTQYDAKRARDCRKIKDDLHYYLIDYDYDFDEETLSGYGLGYDNKTEDNVI